MEWHMSPMSGTSTAPAEPGKESSPAQQDPQFLIGKKVLILMVSENYVVALHIPCNVWHLVLAVSDMQGQSGAEEEKRYFKFGNRYLRVPVTHSENAAAGPGSLSMKNVEDSALVAPLHIPSSPPHSTSPAIRCCGLWLDGGRDVDRCHHKQDPKELSLLPASTFQSPVPPIAVEAYCTGTLFKPPSLLAIDYLSKSPFDYLSENKTL
ncbi:hypothetical protein HGM15179_001632 [Zosterops borbonicus]|uniref:Uncharacterized protein n=1 Tax=Zosterops borbonicus TaxID=364589 RepID=A0A8K1GWB8_9PASS|nr:hypothetical protein HGM15179_001632 [Zosterops borbonicus]